MKTFNLISMIKYILIIICILIVYHPKEIKAQFANGADVGWLSEMEAQGYVFKDNSGVQKDCLEILKEKGINALRFRVWVNPKDGYCGKKDVTYMTKRADSMGFKLMLDFHLSDTWADPGHQAKPAAWSTHSFSKLLDDVYNHIYDVLDTLKLIGVVPAWVQIGNETNNGALWEDGKASEHMDNFAAIIKSGYSAVKDVDSTIQVIVQLSNGHDVSLYRWMFDGLKNNGAKWDIIGMSVYPYWANLPWAEDDSLALITMKDVIERYNTKIMVCEAGYLYNKPVEANHYLLDLIAKTKSVGGLGVFYWEPQSYNWRGYQLGAWDPITKQPTVALDAFLGEETTSVSSEENHFLINSFKLFQNYPNPFNPSTTIRFELNERSYIKMTVRNLLGEIIKELLDGYKDQGRHEVIWDGKDSKGNELSSGVYFVQLNTKSQNQIIKTLLLK